MRGTRVPDDSPFHAWPHGAYGPVERDGRRIWLAVTPNGMHADLSKHDVIEHDDVTVTVAPSIMVTRSLWVANRGDEKVQWHGYLERGVWREC